jgi:hypothetical protein
MLLRFQLTVTTNGYRNCIIQRKYLIEEDTVENVMKVLQENKNDFGNFEGNHKFTNVNMFSTNIMKLEYGDPNSSEFKIFEIVLVPVFVLNDRLFEVKETFIENF